jgi:hypothetical protein
LPDGDAPNELMALERRRLPWPPPAERRQSLIDAAYGQVLMLPKLVICTKCPLIGRVVRA